MAIPKIALLVPTTSRGCKFTCVEETPVLRILGHSINSNLQPQLFSYVLYLGYDPEDRWYTARAEELRTSWVASYPNITIVLVRLDNTTTLVSKWNLLFGNAISDQCEYFYQLGDDIRIMDSGWEQEFIDNLQTTDGLGVTGPLDMNNTRILTQSFTSRRHHDIFGFYFEPRISNWYCDDWITHVYPKTFVHRSKRRVQNMSGRACRYVVDSSPKAILGDLLIEGRKKVLAYNNN